MRQGHREETARWGARLCVVGGSTTLGLTSSAEMRALSGSGSAISAGLGAAAPPMKMEPCRFVRTFADMMLLVGYGR